MSIPLYDSASSRVTGATTSVFLSVKRSGYTYRIKQTIVSCTGTQQPPPTVKIYRNVITPSTLLDSSYDASQNSSDTEIVLGSGEQLLAVFTGAQIGSYVTVTILGAIENEYAF